MPTEATITAAVTKATTPADSRLAAAEEEPAPPAAVPLLFLPAELLLLLLLGAPGVCWVTGMLKVEVTPAPELPEGGGVEAVELVVLEEPFLSPSSLTVGMFSRLLDPW